MSAQAIVPDKLKMLLALANSGAPQTSDPALTATIPSAPIPQMAVAPMQRLPIFGSDAPKISPAAPSPAPAPMDLSRLQAPAPTLPSPSAPNAALDPQVAATQNRALGDMQEQQRLINSGSGVQQITRPVDAQGNLTGQKPSLLRRFGGVLARIGDTAESIVAPGVAALTPGTTLHHDLLLNQQAGRVNNDLADEQREAGTSKMLADIPYEQAQTNLLLNPKDEFTPVPTTSGIESFSRLHGTAAPISGPNGQPLMPYTKPGTRQHVFLKGADGNAVAATFDPQSGVYYDAHDQPIQNPQPYEKPTQPNQMTLWLQEHPGKTVDDYIAMLNQMKPEFPRIQPVNDAKGNTVGYVEFTGTAGGVRTSFTPASAIPGLPQNLGSAPGVIPPKPTSSVLTQSQRAEMIQPQVAALEAQVAKTAGEIGPMAGRWADVMAGKIGADNPDIAKLQMQLKLFATALMLAHGLRGEAYERSLNQYLNAAQSPGNLLARIQGADAYLTDYAQATGHGTSNTNSPSLQEFTDGGVTYRIPADKVAEFKRDHPNAR